MMRKTMAGLIGGAALLAGAVPAQAQPKLSRIDWAGTSWSGYSDCSTNVIALARGGGVTMNDRPMGSWKKAGAGLNILFGTPERNQTFAMVREGEFSIHDPANNRPGSRWERCDPKFKRPYMTKAWMDGGIWSGFGDCKVLMVFNKNGTVSMGNNYSGVEFRHWEVRARWNVTDSVLNIQFDGRPAPLRFSRYKAQLVDMSGGGALTNCASQARIIWRNRI